MTESFDEAWDRLCIDPFQSELEEGRAQGKEDGERAGFRQGYRLGNVTAIEYGMEIGFALGVVKAIEELHRDTDDERIRHSVQVLRAALDDFPDPEEIFQNQNADAKQNSTDISEEEVDGIDKGAVDIASQMQRIRARLRLLTVQLGAPMLSLKSVMDHAARDSSTHTDNKARKPPPKSTEW
jgi:hypothetical protein